MSGGVTATSLASYATIAAAGLQAVSMLTGGDKGQAPKDPVAPEKPPQAAKAPDAGAVRKKNTSALTGAGMGNSSTFLTGPSGIDDTLLNLGKSTLLGQ